MRTPFFLFLFIVHTAFGQSSEVLKVREWERRQERNSIQAPTRERPPARYFSVVVSAPCSAQPLAPTMAEDPMRLRITSELIVRRKVDCRKVDRRKPKILVAISALP